MWSNTAFLFKRSTHILAEKIAIMELDNNRDIEALKDLYREILQHLFKEGKPKDKIAIYCMQIIINKKSILTKNDDIPSQTLNEPLRKIYGEIAFELGYIDSLEKIDNYNTEYDYEMENSEYIKLIKDTIFFLKKSALPKLKKNHFASLIKDDSAEIALHDWDAQLKIASSFFDHKEKCPVNTQHLLLHSIATMSSYNDASNEYFKQRIASYNIVRKQLAKYRKGEVKNIPPLYKPQNRDQAMMWNYLGIQCTCESWRVIEHEGFKFKCICLDCSKITRITQPIKCNSCIILFYKEDIQALKEKTKCPHCNENFTGITLKNIEAVIEGVQ